IHLGLEGGVSPRGGIGLLQIEDKRHQRLGDVASAIETEMAALVRPGAIGVERWPREGGGHEALALGSGRGAFADWMKRRTRYSSFSLASSTPDDTSTIEAPVMASASHTLSGSRPPERAKGRSAE